METILRRIQELARRGALRVSAHGYNELEEDDLLAGEVVAGLPNAVIVEEYPEYPKGPCVLVRQVDARGQTIHALWGVPAGKSEPAVLITAYRPDPIRWSDDFMRRRK